MPEEQKSTGGRSREELVKEINEVCRERARVRMRTYLYKKKIEDLKKNIEIFKKANSRAKKRVTESGEYIQ